MMKQFRAMQEQQKWQRGIQEQQLELQRRRLEQPKEKSIQEQRWDMANAKVTSGEWTRAQGDKYKMSGELPMPKVKYPATTVANVKDMFQITDEEWKGLPNSQKGAYFKEFQLRTRPSTKVAPTPEEKKIEEKYKFDTGFTRATIGRLERERERLKKTVDKAYGTKAQEIFETHLDNINDALDFMGQATVWIAGGKPLGKKMSDAVKQIGGSLQRVRTGETMKGIRASFMEEAERIAPTERAGTMGLVIGKTYEDKDGNKAIYRGIGADGKARWERVR